MKPSQIFGILGIILVAGTLSAQESPQKGKIKQIDAAKSILTLTVDGKDQDYLVSDDTRVMDPTNKQVEHPFKAKAFVPGASVMFRAERRDGQNVLVGVRIIGEGGSAPGEIRRAKLQKIDFDTNLVTLKVADKEVQAYATEQTQLFEAKGKDLKEKLQNFKAGADVFFVTRQKDGKDYLVGLRLAGPEGVKQPLKKFDSSKLVPLNELGAKEYQQGFKGGFYPDGKNERPAAHEQAGLHLAKQVQPLNAEGKPHTEGKIVLLSVGMSNTSQASGGFQKVLASDEEKNPRLLFVNGAVGGMTAARIQNPDNADGAKYWKAVDQRLEAAGVTRAQVQVIWIKQADAGPSQGFPAYAKKLQEELTRIVQIFPKRFPNAKLVYLSSRTYGGYATSPLNPEPYAYESAFSVRWLIEQQLKDDAELNYDPAKGAVKAPWLSWGPYLWANGSTKRTDGFSYEQSDFTANDGTHLTPAGMQKVGRHMLQFFKTDSTTHSWFTNAR